MAAVALNRKGALVGVSFRPVCLGSACVRMCVSVYMPHVTSARTGMRSRVYTHTRTDRSFLFARSAVHFMYHYAWIVAGCSAISFAPSRARTGK